MTTDDGRTALGYEAGSTGPRVILVHEIYGLNAQMRSMADQLAAAGFRVLAIDLFGGRWTDRLEEGFALANALDWGEAVRRIVRAAESPDGAPVGVLGFCMGGSLALLAAAAAPLAACVCYYGIPA